MLPFCGYHTGDRHEHRLNMGRRMAKQPKSSHFNWFRTDENGSFLWPGYSENLCVIERILIAAAVKTPIGYVPIRECVDLNGANVTQESFGNVFSRREMPRPAHRQLSRQSARAGWPDTC